jgi:hypothetical protein
MRVMMSKNFSNVVIDTTILDKVLAEEPQKVGRWLSRFAEGIVTDIKLSFGQSPSAVGDPPGVDTGTLRASIRWENTGPHERTISDGVEYGAWLEFGTEQNGGARPFMSPAFERARDSYEEDAKAYLGIEDV